MTSRQEVDSTSELNLPPDLKTFIYHLLLSPVTEDLPDHEMVLPRQRIERKFLVPHLPAELKIGTPLLIREGYLQNEASAEISIRDEAGVFTLSEKKADGTVNVKNVDELTFKALWERAKGYRVEKLRYVIEAEDHSETIILDVYQKDHKGLVRAKIKFKSESDANGFDIPSWLGAEVTNEPEFKNKSLALQGVPIPSRVQLEAHVTGGIFADKFPEDQIEKLLKEISQHVAQRKPLVVVIGGWRGKSAIIEQIRNAFPDKNEVVTLSLHNYIFNHEYIEALKALGQNVTLDHPEAIRWSLLIQHVETLLRSHAKIVIVEGPLALHLRTPSSQQTIKVFVESNQRTSLAQWVLADIKRQQGDKDPIAMMRYYLNLAQSLDEEEIAPTKRQATHKLINTFYAPTEAGRWGVQKTNLKYDAHPEAIEKLFALQARELGQVTHYDYYFKPAQDRYSLEKEFMRIRVSGEQAMLMFGNNDKKNDWGVEKEVQIPIDRETQEYLLETYRFDVLRKKRSVYQLGSVIVTISEVESMRDEGRVHIGTYVELTGAFGEDVAGEIRNVAEQLGLNFDKLVNKPYSLLTKS